ncbi:MAG: DUF1634 domain-containing protein [Candidatus Bathyarchaeia archaeon]|jgi:uncharacterized membrane protein
MKRASSEEKLDSLISYILILGVLASVTVEALGIADYYSSSGNLNILFQPSFAMKGTNFFSYAGKLFQELSMGGWSPTQVLGLGIVVLMLTPYLRVVASALYFALSRNPKYLLITLFVLFVLTASLLRV